jgi:hypothetical protein
MCVPCLRVVFRRIERVEQIEGDCDCKGVEVGRWWFGESRVLKSKLLRTRLKGGSLATGVSF